MEMDLCDICNTPAEGNTITAEQMRMVKNKGYSPFKDQPVDSFRIWRDLVNQSQTDWNLCPDCAAKIAPYLLPGPISLQSLSDVPGSNILRGHEQRVNDAAVSPDGRRVLTCSWDSTVRLWDFNTGKQISCFREHKDFVQVVAFHPNGRIAASAGADRVIRLWDVDRGTVLHRLQGHSFTVFDLAFSLDGAWLVSGSGDNTVRLWDTASGKQIRKFGSLFGLRHKDGVQSVAFSPDSRRVISIGRTAILWDTANGQSLHAFGGSFLRRGLFLDDGRQSIFSHRGGFLVYDTSTGALLESLAPESLAGADICSFVFTPNKQLLACASRDVIIYDLETRKTIKELKGHGEVVNSISVSTDGKHAATASDDWTARTWLLE